MASVFLGRLSELQRLEQAPPGTLVTLWGPGGVGKTRLAREHAERERAAGRTVAWADLASARTRRDVVAGVAGALGVTGASDDRDDDAIDDLGRAAAEQSALVVLDNLEQLDDEGRAAIVTFARAAKSAASSATAVTLVATSREATGAPNELTIALAPLAEADALALFESLAGTTRGDDTERAIVRGIVKRLDALPLAIELAAARVPLLGITELAARLDRKLDVLGSAKNDRPSRHATLRAAIAWSWDLLDDADRDALMACATFEAPFDAALAEMVIGKGEPDALDRLERLRERALVHSSADGGGRQVLWLLESVRDFAREMDEVGAARFERYAAAIAARAEPLADAARCGRDTWADLERMRRDLVAASRAPSRSRPALTLALAALLAISGPATAAISFVDDAVVDANGLSRVNLIVAKGDALRAAGRLDEACSALEQAIQAADELGGDVACLISGAEARRVHGSVLRALGHIDRALSQKEAALATYRHLGDLAREGICLGEIGAVHQSQGRLSTAKRLHTQAIAIHMATAARRAEGVERSYLAVATHRAGDPAAALALHEHALAIHREVGHRRLEGAELLHLGFVRHELGKIAEAREAFAAARKLLVAAGARGLEAIALVFSARLEVDAGERAVAVLRLAQSTLVAPPTWPRLVATRHLVEGHIAMATGAHADARASYEAALATSRDLEVGFEALTPAYLALAMARGPAPQATEIDAQLAIARASVAPLENAHLHAAFEVLAAAARGLAVPDNAASSSPLSSEVRRALALAGGTRDLTVDDQGKRVVLPDGRAIDLSRRKNVRLVLLALAHARRDSPGVVVSPHTLVEAGWPGERMRADAATKRLHTAIWTLRSLGFESLLQTEGDGYLLDPRVPVRVP